MNREQARALLPIIQAFSEGKAIQYRRIAERSGVATTWANCVHVQLETLHIFEYRVKPEPQYRPWTADECPKVLPVALKQHPNQCAGVAYLQVGYDQTYRLLPGQCIRLNALDLFRDYVRVHEDGSTSPCGKLVTE